MSISPSTEAHVVESSFDVLTVQAIARTHGIALSNDESRSAAANITRTLQPFARITARLLADDDPHLFRRILEREGRRP